MNEILQETPLNQVGLAVESTRVNYGELFGYDESDYEYDLGDFIQCLHKDYLSNEDFVRILRTFPESMHQEIADRIIDESYRPSYLMDNLNFFKNIDLKKVAEDLLTDENDYECYFYNNLEIFEEVIDYQELADSLLWKGNRRNLAENLHKFKGVDHEAISQNIVEFDIKMAASNIRNLTGVDNDELAWHLLDPFKQGEIMLVGTYFLKLMRCLGEFQGLSQRLAETLTKAGYGYKVAQNINSFVNLDEEFVEKIKAGYKEEFESQ